MLKFKDGNGVDCEVALDDDGAYVMLGLKHGKARFRQALSAADAGRLLRVLDGCDTKGRCCEGDLNARVPDSGVYMMLELAWHDEGAEHAVLLDFAMGDVLHEALKHYCHLLMRTPCGGMT